MKLRSILLVASAAFLLTACGGDNSEGSDPNALSITLAGNTTVEVGSRVKLNATVNNDGERLGVSWESSDSSIASVDGEGYVTGLKEGDVTITATSLADTSVSSSWQLAVLPSSIPSVAIEFGNGTTQVGTSLTLEADIYNPTTYTPRIQWTTTRGKGNLGGARTERASLTGNSIGTEIVNLEVNIGPYTIKQSVNVYISDNYNDPAKAWVAISDAETFIENFFVGGDINGNYYLAADIDLGGYEITTANRGILVGVLDGRGHKISNFALSGEAPDTQGYSANAGFFNNIAASGAVRNLHMVANLGESASGWGSSALTKGCDGKIDNVLLEVEHSFDNGMLVIPDNDYYCPFNAGLVGVPANTSEIYDCVVSVTGVGASTMYADCAYPSGSGAAQTFTFDGIYTNSTLVGGQTWDWGGAVADTSGYVIGIDWANASPSEYYSLSSSVWNVAEGSMPSLKVM